jgi:fibro-slime domain-containing protein
VCTPVSADQGSAVTVTIVYRDFRGNDLPNGHPDFENVVADDRGIPAATLGSDHKPQYGAHTTTTTTHGSADYAMWYRDTPGQNITVVDTLTLTGSGGTYAYDNGSFFPLDTRGWVALGQEPLRSGHNFSFTSELRYWFQYAGTESLTFRGDDDVWVFVNDKLALDLGGVHGAETQTITLSTLASSLDLTIGGTYEVVVFQAERHTTQSSYRLTLEGFNATHSVCADMCGDGVTSSNEVCDDGVNMGGYDSCEPGCLAFGPRCGDGTIQMPQEQCDDGAGNTGGYGRCAPDCQLGPHCGDGIVQMPQEQCDDGNTDDNDGCSNDCKVQIE